MKLRKLPSAALFVLVVSLSHTGNALGQSFGYGSFAGNTYCQQRLVGNSHETAWLAAYRIGLTNRSITEDQEIEQFDEFAGTVALKCNQYLGDWINQ